jgi:hypothetical protein
MSDDVELLRRVYALFNGRDNELPVTRRSLSLRLGKSGDVGGPRLQPV